MSISTQSHGGATGEDDSDAPSASSTGALPDRYRIERQSGSPSTGTRLVATDSETGERFFIKCGPTPDAIRHEAEILSALDHPGIVRLKSWRAEPEAAFLVLDWVNGPDLEAFIARQGGRLAATTLLDLLSKLADGVAAIHAGGFVHRDLKPANIVVGDNDTPIILDFGAAATAKRGIPPSISLVTDGYAAPEQYLTDEAEGPWTDIYALGAVAYRALTGKPPPPAPARLKGEVMAPAADAPGNYPEALRRAIDRALAMEPGDRPQTVAEWRTALDIAFAGTSDPLDQPAAGGTVVDDYPPTVRVERIPGDRVPRSTGGDGAGAQPPAPRRRSINAVVVVLLVGIVGGALAAAVWFGWPLYERYVKTDWIVDPEGGGDAVTIADALSRAGDGATIAIRPGLYAENVVIDRPAHLTAAVTGEPPVIAPEGGPCLIANGVGGSVSGLRLHAAAGGDPASPPTPCLVIAGGLLSVNDNRISSASGPAILVRDGADPDIRDNTIEDSAGPGIVITSGARGTITGNTITDAAGPSLTVRGGAAPKITGNTIERSGGAVFAEGAKGSLTGNRIVSSRTSAVEVTTGADPEVVDNSIEGSAETGIFVYDFGKGHYEGNTIVGSHLSGVVVASGAAPRLIGNVVRESGEHGVLVIDDSAGVVDRNAVSGNHGHGIAIGPHAETELGENRLDGNTEPQVLDARTP
jgi:parallel beta-helix repeat protein